MSFTLNNQWAVVTGASSGIGTEIARRLAGSGCHVVLVARRQERLNEVAARLEQEHRVQTRVLPLDLTEPGAAQRLGEAVADLPITVLVNNAGFGKTGPFNGEDFAVYQRMVTLNILFLSELTYQLLPRLREAAGGARILNVGSIAGYQGVPNMVVYSATKAYVNHFSEGLHWELSDTKVRVTNLAPGKTESEFFDVASMRGTQFARTGVLSAERVANLAVKAMVAGKRNVITGWDNRLNVFALRFSPRWLVGVVLRFLFREMK
ncbi:SDR family NAD(P)-dependent oxidoreductase [Acanthopleuribacter pedis]|uniref:SDR family oxidoreductase n=1 Tax=Acanthopleuribacter pedis TaxID=442870 RepID=A0A8J7Q918_9BACT|nr:SDR family oxidoreductase [Acanthopleuribacter pedis]MBO1320130.1 SDR family oxidoreductase [Acanthopleuribacter pedis]